MSLKLFLSTFLLILYCGIVCGQEKKCKCENNTVDYIDCDTLKLEDGSFLYWQHNCDSAWLTLEKANKEQMIIDIINYIPQAYRIGYHLIKEYKKSLFFMSGCAANGPCDYIIIDKSDGKIVKEFSNEEEYIVDIFGINNSIYKYDFVVYFTKAGNISVYKIEERRTLSYPFYGKVGYPHPESTFEIKSVKSNKLKLHYRDIKDKAKTLTLRI